MNNRHLLFLLFLCVTHLGMAQNNFSGFNYQAVVRNASGDPVANQSVGVRVLISEGAGLWYSETHALATDAYGQITLVMGEGTPQSFSLIPTFQDIDWGSGETLQYFIYVDATGGTNYQYLGGGAFKAVPYALHAMTSSDQDTTWTRVGDDLYNANPGNVGVGTDNPSSLLQVGDYNDTTSTDLKVVTGGGNLHRSAVKLRHYSDAFGFDLLSDDAAERFQLNTVDDGVATPRLTVRRSDGKVGIGTTNPSATMDILGDLRIADGTEGVGKVLTSDENGHASWQAPMTGGPGAWAISGTDQYNTNTGNVGIGTTTPAAKLEVAGSDMKVNGVRIGRGQTTNTFPSNIAIGASVLGSNTTGGSNVAIGDYSLYSNTTGYQNVAVGEDVLGSNISGMNNVGVGRNALLANTSGSFNTAIGYQALRDNQGESNSALGQFSLLNNISGANNTAMGYEALKSNSSGSLNTAIGYRANVASGDLVNATAVGAGAYAAVSNTMILGSIQGINGASSDVNVGIGTNTPTNRLEVGSITDEHHNHLQISTGGGNQFKAGIKLRHWSNTLGYDIESDEGGVDYGFSIREMDGNGGGSTRLFVERLSGQVGMGTTTPNFGPLHLSGSNSGLSELNSSYGAGLLITDDILPRIYLENTAAPAGQRLMDMRRTTEGGLTFGSLTDDGTGWVNDRILHLTHAGNVGIGTNTPASKLDVEGGLTIGAAYAGTNAAPANGALIQGRVGIGTTTPNTALSLGSSTPGLKLALYEATNGQDQYGFGVLPGRMTVMAGGVERMTVTAPDGNVGIGTSNPSNPLTITSNRTGPWNNTGSYAMDVEMPSGGQGIFMRVDQSTINSSVSYMTFAKQGTGGWNKAGRIRGFNYNDANDWSPPDAFDEDAICWFVNMLGGLPPSDPIGLALLPAWVNLAGACKNQGVIYESSLGDYAEYLPLLDSAETVSWGDIVGVKGGRITLNTNDAEQFMSVSVAPIVLGNMPPDSLMHLYRKVGFMGQVPIKVRGRVRSGDYIVPSGKNDGSGIAVHPDDLTIEQAGRIVGRSWTTYEGEGLNYVNAVIGVRTNEVAQLLARQEKRIGELEAGSRRLEQLITEHAALLETSRQQQLAIQANAAALQELRNTLDAQGKK